jgi:hypothetical protein
LTPLLIDIQLSLTVQPFGSGRVKPLHDALVSGRRLVALPASRSVATACIAAPISIAIGTLGLQTCLGSPSFKSSDTGIEVIELIKYRPDTPSFLELATRGKYIVASLRKLRYICGHNVSPP